jgi:arabinogalactan oligomer/maltooligosaccharide transport system permease protein
MTLRQQVITQVCLALAGSFVVVPLLWIARLAFDATITTKPQDAALIPHEWTFANFARAWASPISNYSFVHLLGNSLLVAGSTALIALVFGTTTAYAFARYRFPGRRAGLFAMLVLLTLPPAGLMAPYFIFMLSIGLRGSLLGLVFAYSAITLPLAIWTVRNAVQGVPLDQEEAAVLEGASRLHVFARITLPQIGPAVAVAAFIAFVLAWSEFALGWGLISDPDRVTLAMALYTMRGSFANVSWGLMSAMALMLALPVLALFYLLGRYLLSGLTLGAASE